MSSILTNMSAMTAVQNLAATQKSLADVQNQISTGLKVSSAKDNAAYYSIATNMRTNIGNLSAVSDSLNLGSSVVATATSATSNLTTVLQSISKALVAASQPGTDLNSVNTQIAALRTQLANTVATSSFNGVNLLDGSNAASPQVKFVAGVTGTGANTTVNTLTIDTSSTNFQGAAYVTGGNTLIDAKATADAGVVTATAANQTAQTNLTTASTANTNALQALNTALAGFSTSDYSTGTAVTTASSNFAAAFGASATADINGNVTNISATSLAGKLLGSGANIAVKLSGSGSTTALSTYTNGASASGGTLTAVYGASATQATTASTSGVTGAAGVANTATANLATATAAATSAKAAINANATASAIYNGSLFSLSQISLTSASADGTTPATSASQIATYIQQVGAALTAVNNASETLGAASSNISLQSTYTSSLSASITSGVGSLVDADMNEASTRLSALQTQQQLGVQALSTANQNSQLILKLFQ